MTLEKAKKLLDEEYERAKGLEWVDKPIAYALYHVWRTADAERKVPNENRCVSCGIVIPEGRQICPNCGVKLEGKRDES